MNCVRLISPFKTIIYSAPKNIICEFLNYIVDGQIEYTVKNVNFNRNKKMLY